MFTSLSATDVFGTYKDELRELRERVEQFSPVSVGKKAFIKTITRLVDELTDQLDIMALDLDRAGRTKYATESARRTLDLFCYHVNNILEASGISLDLEYFLDQVVDDFKVESQIPVVLMPYAVLGSDDMITKLRKILSMFLFPSDLGKTCIRVIYVPQTLIRDPLYWPLLIHEIAHAVEDIVLRATEKFYPLKTILDLDPESIAFRKHEYSMEHEVDTIATRYSGPIYVRKLFENYFYEEISISPSHPIWLERFKIMLREVHPGIDSLADIRSRLRNVPPGLIQSKSIEHLPEILEAGREFLEKIGMEFRPSASAVNNVKKKLVNLHPYTEDMRLLLNAAYLAKSVAISNLIDERLEHEGISKKEVGREQMEQLQRDAKRHYDTFVRDCLRLTRLRKVFPQVVSDRGRSSKA